jgi:hypothetical protein
MAWNPNHVGELKTMATEHYRYEATELYLQGRRVRARDVPDQLAFNAALEGALVHVRVLSEFFYKNPPEDPEKNDTVTAGHYVGTEWHPREPVLNKDEYDDINAQLSHLAGRRLKGYDWVDALPKFMDSVAAAHTEFLRAIPSERRPWFADATKAVEAWQRR